MSPTTAMTSAATRPIVYPDTDGLPMAENTKQFEAIVTIKKNLDLQFRDDPMVFVAGDLFWYPEEGNNKKRTAPDVMVVFGVPKGHRGSYMQWVENGIAPQVVFEVLSPGNRVAEMSNKFGAYERQGVEEYYLYDPESGEWDGWLRASTLLEPIKEMHGWTSPRLQIKFESVEGSDLTLYGSNGKRFLTVEEIEAERRDMEEGLQIERLGREQATRRADAATQRAEAEAQRAEEADRRAAEAAEEIAKLRAALTAAGISVP